MHKDFQRTDRVSQLIHRELATLITHEINDPRFPSMVTVTAVDVSPDFTNAKVYLISYGSEEQLNQAVDILNAAAAHLRHCLMQSITLRMVPHLKFVCDLSVGQAARISQLLEG